MRTLEAGATWTADVSRAGRAAAVGADDQVGAGFQGDRADPAGDPGHPPGPVPPQAGDRGAEPDVRAGAARGVGQDRVQDAPARGVQRLDTVPGLDRDGRHGIGEMKGSRPNGRGSRPGNGGEQSPAVQLQDRAPHERVGRQGVRAVAGLVQHQHPGALPGQQQRGRGARAAGPGDDRVVVLEVCR
jgi:hypothetical protein